MNYNEPTTRRIGTEPPGVCALVQDMLPFYLDGDLSTPSRAFIDEHLATCERCSSFLAGGRSVQEHLRRDSSLRTDHIRHDPVAHDVVIYGRRQLMGYTLIGAGIAALVVIGVLLGSGGRGLWAAASVMESAPVAVPARPSDAFSGIATATPVPAQVPPGSDLIPTPPRVEQPPFAPTAVPPVRTP